MSYNDSTCAGGCGLDYEVNEWWRPDYKCECSEIFCKDCALNKGCIIIWEDNKYGETPTSCIRCMSSPKEFLYENGNPLIDPKIMIWLIEKVGLQDNNSKKDSVAYFLKSYNNTVNKYKKKHKLISNTEK